MSHATNWDYQFVPVPLNLFNCLDNNCRSVLFTLIQLSSYYGKEENGGWFYRTNGDLGDQCNLSKNVLNGALDALYRNGIVDIIPCEKGGGKKQIGRKYRVLFNSFKKYEEISIEDTIKNPDYKIKTCDYKKCSIPSFQLKEDDDTTFQPTSTPTFPLTSQPTSRKSDNNINNIDNIKNIENIELIYNKLIENRDRIIEEGLDKFDYELYSDTSMSFLDDHGTELFNSYRYFNSDEFDGKQKFYELVSSDSSIGYEEIEQLFKYCIRTQAFRDQEEIGESSISSTEELPIDSNNIEGFAARLASLGISQEEDDAFLAYISKCVEKLAAASVGMTQLDNYAESYEKLINDCMGFYHWSRTKGEAYVRELLEGFIRILYPTNVSNTKVC